MIKKILLTMIFMSVFHAHAQNCPNKLNTFDQKNKARIWTMLTYSWSEQDLPNSLGFCKSTYTSTDEQKRIVKEEKAKAYCCKKQVQTKNMLLSEDFLPGCYTADIKTQGKEYVEKQPLIICNSQLEEITLCQINNSYYKKFIGFFIKQKGPNTPGVWRVDQKTKGKIYAKKIGNKPERCSNQINDTTIKKDSDQSQTVSDPQTKNTPNVTLE